MPLYGIMSGAYYFVGEVFIPSRVHCASCRKIKSENLRRLAVPCSKVRTCADRHSKISTLLRESLRAWHARFLPHRIAKQAGR